MKGRLITLVAFALSEALVIACANVADLGVTYEGRDAGPKTTPATVPTPSQGGDTIPGTDTSAFDVRQKVRPSSVVPIDASVREPPPDDLFACAVDGGVGGETGCNASAGLGCCISPIGAYCMGQNEAQTTCTGLGAGTLFIACLQGKSDSACCWQTGANGHRSTAYRAECEGDATTACIDDGGCPANQKCVTTQCGTTSLTIGQRGREPQCP